jgi:hypothetical protein
MRRNSLLLVLVLFIVFGCATRYQSQGFTGGFSETQLDKNIFRVSFNGNAYTSSERADDLVLLRSAEIGHVNGFTHFVIVDSKSKQSYSTYTTPTQSTTTATVNAFGNTAYGQANTTTYGGQTFLQVRPSATNTVIYFASRPNLSGMVYDVSFLCSSLGAKYQVACGSTR